MAERLEEQELKALIAQEITVADRFDHTELSAKRTRALEYYQGVMVDTAPAANRSSVVSSDVADTIGWMLPGIIRVFTASDRMAEYEPVGNGDEKFAGQATDYINHIFWKDNPGYRILWDATHDSLLQGNGIVKHWWDDSEDCEYSEHSGMTTEQIALLVQDGAEIVAAKPGEAQMVPQPMPQPDGSVAMVGQPIETYSVKLKRVTRSGGVKVECIEPENFLMDTAAVCIEDARFVAHRDEKTRSELIEMGFDREQVEQIPIYQRIIDQEETSARRPDYDALSFQGHESVQPVELYECYIRVDVDGDGIAETVRAYYAGKGGSGELLDWEVWDDDVPFSDIPCEPVPHRWDARSIADETMDMQRVNTVITRQMLDNLYWVNNPMQMAQEDSIVNPEMMAAPLFGGTVWVKKGAMLPPTPMPVPFIGDKALMALEHFGQVIEKRTGVSRSTMALDPETLQNQSATANQNQKDASYSQVELIARNQAELGWKRVFKAILRLVVKHQDRPRVVRLKDEPVEIDPRFWNTAMDVTINVGLGTGSRDRDMQMLNNILQTQSGLTIQMFQAGMKGKAVQMLPKIIKTAIKLAESAGIRNPDEYYPDISDEEAAQMAQMADQPQPDPAIELEKAKTELTIQSAERIEAAKLQAQMQASQLELQAKQQTEQMQMHRESEKERAQMQADLVIKQAEVEKDQMLEAQRIGFEREKMAEEARQKDLDRRLALTIKSMEIEAQRAAAAEANALKRDVAAEQNQLQREQGERDADVKLKTAKAKTPEKK